MISNKTCINCKYYAQDLSVGTYCNIPLSKPINDYLLHTGKTTGKDIFKVMRITQYNVHDECLAWQKEEV